MWYLRPILQYVCVSVVFDGWLRMIKVYLKLF